MKLAVKVVPGATREGIAGWLGDALKVRVRQVAEAGRANDALLRLLARSLDTPSARIRIVAGAGSPHKTLEIIGMSEAAVLAKLPARPASRSGGEYGRS